MENKKPISYTSGHRARLREKFLETKLVDSELLELLLTYAIPRIDVKPIVKDLIAKFGNIQGVMNASVEELNRVRGVGDNIAIFLKAMHDAMQRHYVAAMKDAPIFHNPTVLENYAKAMLSNKKVEEFHILYLDSKYQLLEDYLHSSGTIDWAAVYPREVVKRALDLNAKVVIMLHNHPNNIASFSTEDIEMTDQVRAKLRSMDIEFFDHLLIAGGIMYSAKNLQLIK